MKIDISHVTKYYGKTLALEDVSATLEPGIHGLLGPNGAGKTTLMRILATLLGEYSGTIGWGDKGDWNHPHAIKQYLGYLPQHFGMYRYLRVEEALKGIAVLKGISKEQEKQQITLAMERTNLTEVSKRKVGQLSGGMLRRLGVAQALLGEPELLILDEPTVGLDPEERIHFRKIIRNYTMGRRITLISSHIVNDIDSLCDHVSILHHGRVLTSGATQDIKALARYHVKEEIVSADALKQLENTQTIIEFSPVNDSYRVRYLTEQEDRMRYVQPTLEDSYSYLIAKGKRNEAVFSRAGI